MLELEDYWSEWASRLIHANIKRPKMEENHISFWKYSTRNNKGGII